jgi:hypothetical protein
MTGHLSAYARAHDAPDSDRAELFWRIANPIMAGLIGFYWVNATGAFFGAVLAIALPFLPAALKRISPFLRNNAARWSAPHLQTAWGRLLAYLPLSLVRVIERRRP